MKNLFLALTIAYFSFSCKSSPEYMDDQRLCDMLVDMIDRDQKYRELLGESKDELLRDSLIQIQKTIDHQNTKMLIEIVQHRGWPNKDSLGCDEFGAPVVIFRHAPKEYFNQIKTLIDLEFEEGRMGGMDHAFIVDHLQGRQGTPFKIVDE